MSAAPTPTPALRVPPALRFTFADVERANDAWGANCGPAALCAILGKTPEEIRPHLPEFEKRHHMNGTMVLAALRELGVDCRIKNADRIRRPDWPRFGLARIQWGGTWMGDEVPVKARFRYTHWVASYVADGVRHVFDVNAMGNAFADWLSIFEWEELIVPLLVADLPPRRDGTWSVSTAVEVLG